MPKECWLPLVTACRDMRRAEFRPSRLLAAIRRAGRRLKRVTRQLVSLPLAAELAPRRIAVRWLRY